MVFDVQIMSVRSVVHKKKIQQRFATEYMKFITFCGFVIVGSNERDEKQFVVGLLSGGDIWVKEKGTRELYFKNTLDC